MNHTFDIVINRVTDAWNWAIKTYFDTSENLISEEVQLILDHKESREEFIKAIDKARNGENEKPTEIKVPNSNKVVVI